MIHIYEQKNEKNFYNELVKCYDKIRRPYGLIIESDEVRTLGKYYRVGFYGARFDDLNGKEFVYREVKATHLFELKDRLKNFYANLFGEANIVVWPDSSKVDPAKLDNVKCTKSKIQ